jgi:hypothetical protein
LCENGLTADEPSQLREETVSNGLDGGNESVDERVAGLRRVGGRGTPG